MKKARFVNNLLRNPHGVPAYHATAWLHSARRYQNMKLTLFSSVLAALVWVATEACGQTLASLTDAEVIRQLDSPESTRRLEAIHWAGQRRLDGARSGLMKIILSKEVDKDTRHAGIDALAQCRTEGAGNNLLELAQTLPENTDRTICLQGCLGLARDKELPPPLRLALCRRASALATEIGDKKQLIDALASIASAESVALLLPYVNNDAVRQESVEALLTIAGQWPHEPSNAAILIDPLYQATQAGASSNQTERAASLLKQVNQWVGPKGLAAGTIPFRAHRIGNFRSEACGVADFNGDGKPDVLAGEYLYVAPDWKPFKFRSIKGSVDEQGKGYRWDFANLPMDVDGDGRMDVVSVDWFDQHAIWFRNTGLTNGEWPMALIEKNGNYETAEQLDVVGDGKSMAVVPVVAATVWYEPVKGPDGKGSFRKHLVSDKTMNFGVGVGDLNNDGRPDIIRPDAWFEAPEDRRQEKGWIEHPIALGAKNGKSTHTPQILVFDVNGDGLNDLITSDAHGYGIFWYEQFRQGKTILFKQHLIDDSWTQAHSLVLADIDGCGLPELIAGKRFMAHNGGDPRKPLP